MTPHHSCPISPPPPPLTLHLSPIYPLTISSPTPHFYPNPLIFPHFSDHGLRPLALGLAPRAPCAAQRCHAPLWERPPGPPALRLPPLLPAPPCRPPGGGRGGGGRAQRSMAALPGHPPAAEYVPAFRRCRNALISPRKSAWGGAEIGVCSPCFPCSLRR